MITCVSDTELRMGSTDKALALLGTLTEVPWRRSPVHKREDWLKETFVN